MSGRPDIGAGLRCGRDQTLIFSSAMTRFDRGALDHAVLERGVVLELAHGQLAPDTPGVEDEAVGIEHGVLISEPFAPRQPVIDLLQVAVEGLEARLPLSWDTRMDRRRSARAARHGRARDARSRQRSRSATAPWRRRAALSATGRTACRDKAEWRCSRTAARRRRAAAHRHAPLRVDLEIGLGALLAIGEVDLLRLILLAALLQHDMRRHRARARSVIQRQHSTSSITR